MQVISLEARSNRETLLIISPNLHDTSRDESCGRIGVSKVYVTLVPPDTGPAVEETAERERGGRYWNVRVSMDLRAESTE
jgi:hypothetical protein